MQSGVELGAEGGRANYNRRRRRTGLQRGAIAVQAPMALTVLYLDLLSVAALCWRRRARPVPARYRFAILIPAHNEESTLPRLLHSLASVRYPRHLFEVIVVADNCTDRTAAVARAGGASTYERSDPQQRGKGYALQWLLTTLAGQQRDDDAYVILDADSVVSDNFLVVLNAYLARGYQAIQAYYGVLNEGESWPAALRYVALTLFNGLRPRGRDALGLSAGLRGNGMCFSAALLQRFGWHAFTLAEDAEFHLQLVAAGVRVRYAAEARVLAEMPVTLRQARSQNQRWERGRLQLLRAHGPRMLSQAMRGRDAAAVDAIVEQLVPPLSVVTGLTTLTLALTSAARLGTARRLAAAIVLGQCAYVWTGLRLAGAAPRAYAALFFAPLYMIWKIALFGTALLGRHDGRWVRTARRGAPE